MEFMKKTKIITSLGPSSYNGDTFEQMVMQFEFDVKDINNINFKVTSQLERVHYYEITKIQNSLYSKIDNNLIFNKNSKNQIIFSIGSEDKLIKIFKV